MKKQIKKRIANTRQLLHPPEFRIDASPFPEKWLGTFEKLAVKPPLPPPPRDDKEHLRFLADLATGIWRLRQKMLEPGTERPKEQFRREYRHLESVWDLLIQAGIEIHDHTGKPFDPGQAIKVLDRIPTPGINRERVQETIKPTVYYKKKHIQMAEVLIETPEKPTAQNK